MHQMYWVLIVSVMLLLMLSLMLRLSFTRRRLLACLLLGAAILSRPLCWMGEEIFHDSGELRSPWGEPLTSADGSLTVEYDNHSPDYRAPDLLCIDDRQQHTISRHFDGMIRPIGFEGQSAVILAQQLKGERRITLSRWSLDSNTVETFASFYARPYVLGVFTGEVPMDSISSDGRYGVMLIHSPYCRVDYWSGFDIWKIDLQLRKVTLLIPAWPQMVTAISWHGDDALIANLNSVFSISMTTGQITPLPLPTPRERK